MFAKPVGGSRKTKKAPLAPDMRNIGGRSQISQLMFNHYNALFNAKAKVKLPEPSIVRLPQEKTRGPSQRKANLCSILKETCTTMTSISGYLDMYINR